MRVKTGWMRVFGEFALRRQRRRAMSRKRAFIAPGPLSVTTRVVHNIALSQSTDPIPFLEYP
jgi:hypothetical protein